MNISLGFDITRKCICHEKESYHSIESWFFNGPRVDTAHASLQFLEVKVSDHQVSGQFHNFNQSHMNTISIFYHPPLFRSDLSKKSVDIVDVRPLLRSIQAVKVSLDLRAIQFILIW